jgi:hypothetical protein
MCARGNGDFRGKNEGVETGLAPSRHREGTTYLQRSARRGKPRLYTNDDRIERVAGGDHVRGQSPSAREEERNHREGR